MDNKTETPKLEVVPVKHINQKTGGVDPRDVIRTGKPVFMGRILGVVTVVKHFEDKQGDPKTVFKGEFAMQGADGKLYQAETMYAFKALEEKFVSTFKSGDEKPVEFVYDITAVPDAKSATGYAYQAISVIPTTTSDRFTAMLTASAATALPKTEAPAPAPATPSIPAATGTGNGTKKK